ncbi:MAG TPA: hypothetical protein PLW01_07820, partial [Agitococcus sp.]|nr:hypothetical protein [Agitococcus sp.]
EIQPASPQGESNNEQTVQTLTNQQHFAVDTQSETVKPTNDQQDKSDKEQANNENNTQTLPVEAEIELATPERGHLIKPEETNVNEVNVEGTAFQRHVTPIPEE